MPRHEDYKDKRQAGILDDGLGTEENVVAVIDDIPRVCLASRDVVVNWRQHAHLNS